MKSWEKLKLAQKLQSRELSLLLKDRDFWLKSALWLYLFDVLIFVTFDKGGFGWDFFYYFKNYYFISVACIVTWPTLKPVSAAIIVYQLFELIYDFLDYFDVTLNKTIWINIICLLTILITLIKTRKK